jgi:hypothetical protein
MKRLLESVVIFGLVLGVWVLFALVVAALASYLPKEEMVAYAGGGVATLGLLVAVGVAARLVRRRPA